MQGMLRRLIVAAALTCSSFAAAQQGPQPAPSPLRFILNGAFTEGGDDLVKVKFKNAESEKIKAGGLLMLGGGLLLTPGSGAVSLQLTLNYHFDSITAKNGDATARVAHTLGAKRRAVDRGADKTHACHVWRPW